MAQPSNENNSPIKDPSRLQNKPSESFLETRKKGHSPLGTSIFASLRLLDLPLQYYLLTSRGTEGLTPYETLILALAIGSALKQIYWLFFVNEQLFTPGFATIIAIYNTVLNTLNTLLANWDWISQRPSDQSSLPSFLTPASLALQTGLLFYTTGLFIEWYSEIQRARFKSQPENKGKPHSGGLFGYARNINYGGYALWRTGYALVSGGWIWAAVMAAWLVGDFVGRAIPNIDGYCEMRVSCLCCGISLPDCDV